MHMQAHTEVPTSLQLPRTEIRIVVKGTFIEVFEDDSSQAVEPLVKRAFSAPVTPTRRDKPSSSKQEEETECLDGPHVVAQQTKEVEGQEGQEPKTTVAIRNVPVNFTRDQLLQRLDAWGFAGQYDFLYLPIDFARCRNFGYCFVNLTTPEHARRFLAELDILSWGELGEGQLVVNWSLNQGLDEHRERYRNSPLMHESVPDGCRPIVLQGGVRVDFPPPTRRVHRLRRLRTRCGSPGSGGRGAFSQSLASCMLLPGLSGAPAGASGEKAILASPLFAGLRRTGTEESPTVPRPRREEAPKALGCSTTAAASAQKKAAWADLHDDFDDGLSECSTQAPVSSSGAISSADGYRGPSESPTVRWCGPGSSDQPWLGSMLAQGLMPALPEEKGAQPMHNGRRTRRLRTIK